MAKKPLKFSVVDAFTESAFKGNPAAVCLLEEDRDDQWLQALAAEFNLSETCYLTRLSDSVSDPALSSTPARFRLRWFTPVTEVDLCGHATLAAASTLFKSGLVNTDIIEFSTLSGILTAKKVPDGVEVANGEAQDSYFIELNFPADPSNEFNSTDALLISNALGGASVIDIRRTTVTDDLLVLLPSGKAVLDLLPQYDEIKKCPGTRGVIVTAVAPPESGYDFYSRFFCPTNGIGEDPVCGSAHCALASYWCNKLGKCDLVAYAASPRGGTINIHLDEQNQRVLLRGKAVTVMEGTVDAFTDSAFKGNPAAVCFLEEDRDDLWMQALATEFNLSQTCYLTLLTGSDHLPTLTSTPRFNLRWFTPVAEVKLCGHATLAAAYTLFMSGLIDSDIIEFSTMSGILTAKKVADHVKAANGSHIKNGEAHDSFFIELNFPADPSSEFNSAEVLFISNALGGAPVVEIMRTVADNLIVVLPSGKSVADLLPQIDAIEKCPGFGVIVTGVAPPESGFDFISRYFCPKFGINEDPVCGSAHCGLAPYWCKKLGKCDVVAYQASPRGGTLNIHLDEKTQRVLLRGKAITVMEGTVLV